jgi:hypothetical protein
MTAEIHPRCMLIEVLGRYNWLNPVVMRLLRERHGTRFVVIAGSETVKAAYARWCAPEDRMLTLDEIEAEAAAALALPADPAADAAAARSNEERFSLTYLQDIVQQDRAIFGTYMPYAASSWSTRKVPELPDLVRRINFYFGWAERLFAAEGIDLVNVRPGGILSTTLVHVAIGRRIPTTMSRPARYGSLVTWTYGPYSAGDFFEDAYRNLPEDVELPEAPILPPEGSRQVFEKFARQRAVRTLARQLLLATYNHVFHSIEALRDGSFARMPSWFGTIGDVLGSWWSLRRLEALSETDVGRLKRRPFVLFLLPKEPEYTVQSLAREFSNLQAIVQQMSLAMPAGYDLVVKEHSRVGYRRMAFYRDLLKLPNVVLASATIPGLTLIAEAAAVATVAGTAALEATLHGKPAIIFTPRVEYAFLPSIGIVTSFFDLARKLREALRPRSPEETAAIRREGARYRLAVKSCSFDAKGTNVFEGNAALQADQADRAIDILLRVYRMQVRDLAAAAAVRA